MHGGGGVMKCLLPKFEKIGALLTVFPGWQGPDHIFISENVGIKLRDVAMYANF